MMLLDKIKTLLGWNEAPKIPDKKIGTIRFFNYSRGYGFIRSRQMLKDVFIHIKDVQERVRVGDKVKFEVERDEKGYRARNVELIKENLA